MSQILTLEYFYALSTLLEEYRKDVVKYHENEIPSLLTFLRNNSTSVIFRESKSFYCRFLLFYNLEALKTALLAASQEHAISPSLFGLVTECILRQPIQDRLQSGLIDIKEWLDLNKTKLANANEDDVSRDDFILYHDAWEDLYRIPYKKPSNDTYDYFENTIKDKRSSSDTFAHIIKAAYENLMRFTALQHEMDSEEIVIHKDIKTMKMKTEELVRIINDNVSEVEISHIMLRNIYELIVECLAAYDPDPFSGLHDACHSLKRTLAKNSERATKKRFPEPPKITFEANLSSLLQTLQIKGKLEIDKANENAVKMPSLDAFSRVYNSGSDFSFGQVAQEVDQEQRQKVSGDLLLEIHNIWIEVDPILGRLNNLKSQAFQSNGVLCADFSGRAVFTSSHIVWFGIPKDLYHRANELKMHGIGDMALSVPFSSIEKFIIEVLPGDYDSITPSSSRVPSVLSLAHGHKQPPPSPPSFLPLKGKEELPTPKKAFYITIYTGSEVYKFFPFLEKEAKFIKEALLECAGIRPSFQDHFVRQLLTEKLLHERREILEDLMAESEYPWLDSSASISKSIASLTDEIRRPDPKELERLFHSCRLEKAVANETIVLLQNYWQVAANETIKKSVLRIIDRLIDPQVMQKADSAFMALYSWLKNQEQYINPYKSPTLVMLVSRLLKRCKAVSTDQLTPLVLSHTKSTFEKWESYEKFLSAFQISQ